MKILLVYLLFTIYYLLLASPSVFAQDYTIDGGVIPNAFNMSPDIIPTPTPKPTLHGLFTGKNYSIQVGFENFVSEQPFSFSISENLIDYGQLLTTNPVTRLNTLFVSSPTVLTYTVQAYENHPLRSSAGSFIPDTTCDNGICNDIVAQPWSGILTYGFGYRCDIERSRSTSSNPCDPGFLDANSYKQFPKEAQPQIIVNANQDTSTQVSYRVNISGSQADQFYSNSITFIAIPNF